jgi:hypothetical protein
MLMNAMLLRIDDPPPGGPGPAIAVRCSMGLPSGAESAAVVAMGMNAAAVLYLPMADAARVGSPAVGQQVVVQLDGCPVETWRVVYAADRVSDVLSHVQLFLEPV